jgi:CRISPR/Cas system-associated exonuclease Cas4 (RecB family)
MNWRLLSADEDGEYLSLLRAVLKEWYSKPREGWHVTDIVMCPRQRVFKQIDPIPPSPTDREINMYSSGKSTHEAIQKLFMSNRMRFEVEKYVEHGGIQGSIDIYDKKKNEPLEFKTVRGSTIKEPKSFHIEQLKYYMAMLDVPIGQIIYQCLMQFGENPFTSFEVTMTETERQHQLQKLEQEIKSLQHAISMQDPALARGVFSDTGMNWLCKDCPYAKSCERIQNAISSA